MAIGLRAVGAVSASTTSPTASFGLPAGWAAGDLHLLTVNVKGSGATPATITTPAGWIAPPNSTVLGGTGTLGADAGQLRVAVFYRVAQAGDTAPTLTLSVAPGASGCCEGHIVGYTKGASEVWGEPSCATAADTSGATTSYGTVTGNVVPHVQTGDWCCQFTGFNGDAGTPGSRTISWPGLTLGSYVADINDVATTTGGQLRNDCGHQTFTSGTGTTAPTLARVWTSGNASFSGATIFYRLRVSTTAIVNGTASGKNDTAQTPQTPTLPAGVQVGELLLVCLANDNANTTATTTSTGWSVLGTEAQGTTTNHTGSIFMKIATGSDTLSVDLGGAGGAQEVTWTSYRIANAGTPEETSTNGAATTSFTAPTETHSRGTADYLCLFAVMTDSSAGLTQSLAVTGFTNVIGLNPGVTSSAATFSAERTYTATSAIAPGTVTLGLSEQYVAFTIAIPPPLSYLRGEASAVKSNDATALTVTLPASTQVGDVVVLIHQNNWYTLAALTTPTGTAVTTWVEKTDARYDGGTNANHAKVWVGTVTTGGGATVIANWGAPSTGDEERYAQALVFYPGCAYDVGASAAQTASTTWTAGAVTAAAAGSYLLVACCTPTGSATNFTFPGSMTALTEQDPGGFNTYRTGYERLVAAGSTGTRSITSSANVAGAITRAVVASPGATTYTETATGVGGGAGSGTTFVTRVKAGLGAARTAGAGTETVAHPQTTFTKAGTGAAGGAGSGTTFVTRVKTGGAAASAVGLGVGARRLGPTSVGTIGNWWAADAVSQTDGTTVNPWPGNTSTAEDATNAFAANRATFKTNIVNGKPVLRFDGTDSYLSAANASLTSTTMFAVLKPTSVATYQTIRGSNIAGGLQWRLNNTGKSDLVKESQAAIGTSSATVSTSAFNILSAAYADNASYAFYQNGTLAGSGTHAVTLVGGATTEIGKNTDQNGEYFVGDLAELIVYVGVLSAADRAKVHSYLADKYALTTSDYVPPSATVATVPGAIYRMRAPLATDGAVLDSVTFEQGGLTVTATGSVRPTAVAAGLNGRPAIRFDGTDDQLLGTAAGGGPLPTTVCVVYRPTSASSDRNITHSAIEVLDWGTGAHTPQVWAGGALTSTTAVSTTAPVGRVIAVVNGASSVIYVNGDAGTTGDAGTIPMTAGAFRLGGHPSLGGRSMAGDLYEVLIFDHALTSGERSSLDSYFLTTYVSTGTTFTKAGTGVAGGTGAGGKSVTRVKAGTAAVVGAGAGVETVAHPQVTSTKAGTGAAVGTGAGAKSVTRVKAGTGTTAGVGAGSETVIRIKTASAVAAGAGAGAKGVERIKTGAGATAGTAAVAKSVTRVKAGSGAASGTVGVAKSVTTQRTVAGVASGTVGGAKVVTRIKAGTGTASGVGAGVQTVAHPQVTSTKAGTGAAAGVGRGVQVVAVGQITYTKVGLGAAAGVGAGVQLVLGVPQQVGTLANWFRADSLAQTDGSAVSSWPDSTGPAGVATQASGAAQPTFKTNIVNGKPVLRFDGTDWLATLANSSIGHTTIFAVVRPTATTGYQTIRGSANPGALQWRIGLGFPELVKEGIAVVGTSTTILPTATFSIISADYDTGTSYALYHNGTTAASGTTAVAIDVAAYSTEIGRITNEYLTGDLAELIVYHVAVLSAGDRAKVHTYLSQKYGITVADYLGQIVKAGAGAASGVGAGAKTVISPQVVYTKAGAGAASGVGAGVKSVTRVKAGLGALVGTAAGVRALTSNHAGAGAASGVGAGVKSVTRVKAGLGAGAPVGAGTKAIQSAGAIVKAGLGAAPLVGRGAQAVDHPQVTSTKAGIGAARLVGAGVQVVAHPQVTSTKAGTSSAAATAAGGKTVDGAASIVKAGLGATAGVGAGASVVAHPQVTSTKAGSGACGLVGAGTKATQSAGTIVKAGLAVAAPSATGGKILTSPQVVYTRSGAAVAGASATGTATVQHPITTAKTGSAAAGLVGAGGKGVERIKTGAGTTAGVGRGVQTLTLALTYTKAGAGAAGATAAGTRATQSAGVVLKAGAGVTAAVAAGARSMVLVKLGTAVVVAAPSGVKVRELSGKTVRVAAVATAAGRKVRELADRPGRGAAIGVASGRKGRDYGRTGAAAAACCAAGSRVRLYDRRGTGAAELVVIGGTDRGPRAHRVGYGDSTRPSTGRGPRGTAGAVSRGGSGRVPRVPAGQVARPSGSP